MLTRPSNLPKLDALDTQTRLQMVQRLWANEDFQILVQADLDATTAAMLTAVKTVTDAELPLARWKWKTMEDLSERLIKMEQTLTNVHQA